MAFRFRLERVLALRRTELDGLRQRMRGLRAEEQQIQDELRAAIHGRREYDRQCALPSDTNLSPLNLVSRLRTAELHARKVSQTQTTLSEVQGRIQHLRSELLEGHRKVKILERLRERKLKMYREEIEAQETKMLDDIQRRTGRVRSRRAELPAR